MVFLKVKKKKNTKPTEHKYFKSFKEPNTFVLNGLYIVLKHCFAAQKDLSCAESGEQGAEDKIFSGLLDGTGVYTLVYEDNDGDRMLAGDIPWK